MKRTKIYSTLLYLSVYERNDFGKFVQSPYFNTNQLIIQFFGVLDTHIRTGSDSDLDKQAAWQQITKEPFVDVKFRKLCADTLRLLEQWLAQKDFESHPYYETTHLLNALSHRKIEELYSSSLSKAERDGKQQLQKSSTYHHFLYQTYKNKYNFTTEFAKKKTKNIEDLKRDIENLLVNLDIFYIIEKLRYYCTILSWKKLTNYDTELTLLLEIRELINEKNLRNYTAVSVYECIMMSMLEPDDESHYYKLKTHIQNDIDIFSPDEVRDIYDSTVSYCIQRVNKGHYEFQQEVLTIYQSSLQSEALYVDGYLSPTTFRNIVFFALRVGDYAWAETFCNDYVLKLRDEHQENAKLFSLARIALYRKDYALVIDLLQRVNYEDIWYNLNSKTLLIASYYELDEYDALESLLNSFKVFISREKSIPEKRKRNYLNLIRYTNQLIKLLPSDKMKLEKLYHAIQDEQMVSKPWLVSKIEALLPNKKQVPPN